MVSVAPPWSRNMSSSSFPRRPTDRQRRGPSVASYDKAFLPGMDVADMRDGARRAHRPSSHRLAGALGAAQRLPRAILGRIPAVARRSQADVQSRTLVLADAATPARGLATGRTGVSQTVDASAPLRHGPVDYMLLVAVAGLLVLGLVEVYSASQLSVPGDPGYWFRRQLIWAALGVVALIVTSRIEYHAWRRVSLPAILLALALCVVVLKVGTTAYGAQRWIDFKVFSFQPSEFAKLALTLYIADWLAHKGEAVGSVLYGLLPFAAVTGLVLGLVLMQNDLGTALIIAALAVAMFFAAGANLLQLVPSLALGGVGLFVLIEQTGFRRARLDTFLHPVPAACAGSAYQVCQGLISLGSGGLFGRGLGDSLQKAGFLPTPFTDSIFAVIGEELGVVGCLTVLGLFLLLAYRGFRAGRRASDSYGALLACGVTCWLLAQAMVNIGSVVDAIPFTGVPLPFVSFGGSSLVTSLAAVGILLNVSRAAHRHRA
jgi:cell division protein FtsW